MNSMLSEFIDIEKTIHFKRIGSMIAVLGEDVIKILLPKYMKREDSYLTVVAMIFEGIFIFVQIVIRNNFDSK